MSFDMNPMDEDPHGECRHEIERLRHENAMLRAAAEAVLEICGECRLDHHGPCQAHSLRRGDDDEPQCEIAMLRAATKQETPPCPE